MAAPVFVFKGELLHQAAIYDQRDLLKSLLTAGVHGEANSLDPRGLTPLHTAALHDSVGCLVELLEWIGNLTKASEDVEMFETKQLIFCSVVNSFNFGVGVDCVY